MAEESLAFYVLIITVMIAAGYDALVGALVILLGCGHRRARLDRQPVCDRHRVRLRRRLVERRARRLRLIILLVGTAHGDLVRAALRGTGRNVIRRSRSCTT